MTTHPRAKRPIAAALMQALEPRLLLAVQPVKEVDVGFDAVDVNGALFFTAAGDQLWKSNGIAAGTVLVKDFNGHHPYGLTNVGGTLYLIVNHDLWKSDGTAAGTVLVKDTPGIFFDDLYGDEGSSVSQVANVDGTAFFLLSTATFGIHSGELWKTDGTAEGTVAIKHVGEDAYYLTPAGRTLYLLNTSSLIRSDGTAEGTFPIAQTAGSVYGLTDVGGTLFYVREVAWLQLWRSDGTAEGTVQVKQFDSSYVDAAGGGAGAHGIFFFAANDGTGSGTELWKSDGTEAGTVLVKDINPGQGTSEPWYFTNVNGTVYFVADDGTNGPEVWRSDGTEAGTVRITDLQPQSVASSPQALVNVNGTLFFGAEDADGPHLFKLDTVVRVEGTAARDVIVAAVNDANIEIRNHGQLIKTVPAAETTFLQIIAGDGDDVIDCSTLTIPVFVSAGNGNDKIAGGSAPDLLGGGAGKDTLDGGLGNDRLNGHGGHDRLFGNAGGDRLYGYDGNDLLDGSSSGDRLYGGNGADTMFGAGGNDRFFAAGDATIDQLFGGKGDDSAAIDASDVLASVEELI